MRRLYEASVLDRWLSRLVFTGSRCTTAARGGLCQTALVCISLGFGGPISGGFGGRLFGPVRHTAPMPHLNSEIRIRSERGAKSKLECGIQRLWRTIGFGRPGPTEMRFRGGGRDRAGMGPPNPKEMQVVERLTEASTSRSGAARACENKST